MKRAARVVATVPAVLLGGLFILTAVGWDRLRRRDPLAGAGRVAQRAWCRGLCRLFGVRVRCDGASWPRSPALLVANHVTWLDIIVIASHRPVAFLSKADVARWPVVGRVASALGTLYIDRGGSGAAAEASARMSRALADGRQVLFFPEGTTSDGRHLRVFRPRLYQAAIDAGVAVQPLAIRYRTREGRHAPEIPYLDGQSLAANVWAIARLRGIDVTLDLTDPIEVSERPRKEIARLSRERIDARLNGGCSDCNGAVT